MWSLRSLSEFLLLRRQLCSHVPSALNAGAKRSEAKRRVTWPCLNVATWRRERSDQAIQQIC